MKKLISIFLFLIVIAGGIGFGVNAANSLKGDTTQKQVLPAKETSNNNKKEQVQPTAVQGPGIPKTITIPSINVEAEVESVGVTGPKKQMEVPVDADNGGWYSLGTRPGDRGSAVIAGHLDKEDSSPAVFWNISKLKAGDKIIVTDENGKDFTFAVVKIAEYPYDNFPIQEVFGANSNAMLNLISCKGKWDEAAKNYSHRTVVYSHLVK